MNNYILSMNPPADCTPDEREHAIKFFAAMPLEELRRRQELVQDQRDNVHLLDKSQRDEALRQLAARDEHLAEAIDRKEFPQ